MFFGSVGLPAPSSGTHHTWMSDTASPDPRSKSSGPDAPSKSMCPPLVSALNAALIDDSPTTVGSAGGTRFAMPAARVAPVIGPLPCDTAEYARRYVASYAPAAPNTPAEVPSVIFDE